MAGIGGRSLDGSCHAGLGAVRVGIGRQAWFGRLPWTEQAGLAGLIPGSGKAFLPGWPGIQAQTKGGFLSCLFVLLPQSAALCMAKANSTLQLGNPLWGLPGLASEGLPFPLPWLLPCSLFSLGLWFPQPGGPRGGPRQGLKCEKGCFGEAEAALSKDEVLWPRERGG